MSNTFFECGGANVLPCQLLGGQMSSYTIFHRGAKCLRWQLSYTLSEKVDNMFHNTFSKFLCLYDS